MVDSSLFSARYKLAVELASELFKDQKRDITEVPYIAHLIGVAHIVEQVSDNEDIAIAALLHDVLEDIPPNIYSRDQMLAEFGPKVVKIVETVSHNEPAHGKDKARKLYLDQLQKGSQAACLVSAADLLYNITDLLEAYQKHPQLVKQQAGGERAARRDWFYPQRFAIQEEKLGSNHPLIQAIRPKIEQLRELHRIIM